jgi:hypothetical protein
MDRIAEYREIIKRIIREYAAFMPEEEGVRKQTVFDDENGHYMLFYSGWDNRRRVHGSVIHVDLYPNGRVYVEHDGTKNGIVDELIEAGIPENNIVLGFHHPSMRQYTPFARV